MTESAVAIAQGSSVQGVQGVGTVLGVGLLSGSKCRSVGACLLAGLEICCSFCSGLSVLFWVCFSGLCFRGSSAVLAPFLCLSPSVVVCLLLPCLLPAVLAWSTHLRVCLLLPLGRCGSQ